VYVAIAHRAMFDDEYSGYHIPKGALLFGNTWSILHDEEIYSNPHEFRPERFLKDGKLDPAVRDPNTAAFGFGRRSCPGQHLAANSAFITIASILSTFDITLATDDFGNHILVEPAMTSGLVSYPKPFKCNIRPRLERTAAVIQQSLEDGE